MGALQSQSTAQSPSLCPPAAVRVLTAVLQMSSNASPTSSPVTAEHSTYRSARITCAVWYASCEWMMPLGSVSVRRSRFSPSTTTGKLSMRWKHRLTSLIHWVGRQQSTHRDGPRRRTYLFMLMRLSRWLTS